MYTFVDRPITMLDPGGRFLVWSMRTWVKAMAVRTCPATLLGPAFARSNMLRGLQPFLRTMATLNRHALENLMFCDLPCNHISEHEAIVLSLICSLRDASAAAVRDTLALLVEEECIGDLLGALGALGVSMDRAAIFPAPASPAV